jgi:FHA domain
VTVVCPAGHVSAATDWCDQCGARIAGAGGAVAVGDPTALDAVAPDAAASGTAAAPDPGLDTSATPATAPCPHCGTPRTGRDRFCEDCGFDFVDGAPAAAAGAGAVTPAPAWTAEVTADADYFARTAPDGLSFPAAPQPQTVALAAAQLRIGRRRSSEQPPDIALGDPAVSRLHATLVQAADGSWAIVDEGSSNGTTINDDPEPIAPHVRVPLQAGDRVHLGAWTTIRLLLRSRAA